MVAPLLEIIANHIGSITWEFQKGQLAFVFCASTSREVYFQFFDLPDSAVSAIMFDFFNLLRTRVASSSDRCGRTARVADN